MATFTRRIVPPIAIMMLTSWAPARPFTRTFEIGSERVPSSEVLPYDSESYHAKVKQLKFDLKQAAEILATQIREENGFGTSEKVPLGAHYVIVGDCYVFTILQKTDIGSIPLRGFYVDGNTGEVHRREAVGRITRAEQRKLWGQIVTGPGGNTLWK